MLFRSAGIVFIQSKTLNQSILQSHFPFPPHSFPLIKLHSTTNATTSNPTASGTASMQTTNQSIPSHSQMSHFIFQQSGDSSTTLAFDSSMETSIDKDFLFSDDSRSGYLSSIISECCLRSSPRHSSPSQHNNNSCEFNAPILFCYAPIPASRSGT